MACISLVFQRQGGSGPPGAVPCAESLPVAEPALLGRPEHEPPAEADVGAETPPPGRCCPARRIRREGPVTTLATWHSDRTRIHRASASAAAIPHTRLPTSKSQLRTFVRNLNFHCSASGLCKRVYALGHGGARCLRRWFKHWPDGWGPARLGPGGFAEREHGSEPTQRSPANAQRQIPTRKGALGTAGPVSPRQTSHHTRPAPCCPGSRRSPQEDPVTPVPVAAASAKTGPTPESSLKRPECPFPARSHHHHVLLRGQRA